MMTTEPTTNLSCLRFMHLPFQAVRDIIAPFLAAERRQSLATAERACCPTCSGDVFPSSPRRGVCAIKKKLRSILSRADGVVIIHNEILAELDHHPGRSIKEASR